MAALGDAVRTQKLKPAHIDDEVCREWRRDVPCVDGSELASAFFT
jgi:hypothetical protein